MVWGEEKYSEDLFWFIVGFFKILLIKFSVYPLKLEPALLSS